MSLKLVQAFELLTFTMIIDTEKLEFELLDKNQKKKKMLGLDWIFPHIVPTRQEIPVFVSALKRRHGRCRSPFATSVVTAAAL